MVAYGERPRHKQHWDRIRNADPLICTDGAANWMAEEQITPHVIIGDMDSIKPEVREQWDMNRIQHISSQENTDLDKGIQYALEQNFTHATILAATGGREDQTLANMYLLARYAEKIQLQFLTNYSAIEAITSHFEGRAEPGQTISLLPVGYAEGVTTSGLKYPLQNETLEIGSRGVSNLAESDQISVSVESGTLLIFRNF